MREKREEKSPHLVSKLSEISLEMRNEWFLCKTTQTQSIINPTLDYICSSLKINNILEYIFEGISLPSWQVVGSQSVSDHNWYQMIKPQSHQHLNLKTSTEMKMEKTLQASGMIWCERVQWLLAAIKELLWQGEVWLTLVMWLMEDTMNNSAGVEWGGRIIET